MAKTKEFNPGEIDQIQARFGLTSKQIARLSESQVRSIMRKLNNPDRPRARTEYARKIEVDDAGRIASGAKENALRQLDSVRARAAAKPLIAGVPCGPRVVPAALLGTPVLAPGAGVAAAAWRAIGPGNVGGRTRAMVLSPDNPSTLWAGSAGGGVWRSDDDGASWTPVDDLMANLAVCCMVMDPSNSNIIYAGTGEGFNNVDAIRGAGIFITTDQVNWSQLPATNRPEFHYVNRIAVSKNGQVVLAGTSSPFTGGSPNAFGIFRSDDPARNTWTRVLNEQVGDVKFNPKDNRKAVAGGLRNGEAYYSTDGGATWHEAEHDGSWSGRVELAYAAKDPTIVYASVESNSGEIWRSTDGGKTYSKRKAQDSSGNVARFLGDQGWYDNVIWAGHTANSDFVIVGGIDLWRSTDGGDTLKPMSNWREDKSAHADHHAIVSSPGFDGTTNRTVYFGNDGGVYKASNVETVGNNPTQTNGWTNLVNGYDVTQFYGGAGNSETGTVIGGAQDNGTLAFTPAGGSQAWIEIQGGDGGFCAADPNDTKYFYGEYTYLSIFRNTNGATSNANWWETYINGQFWNPTLQDWDWKPIPFRIPDSMASRALFIAPFVLDPNDSNRMLGGGASLWRSDNVKKANTNSTGPSWKAIKSSIGAGVSVSAIAIAQGNSKIVWVGYENGEVAATQNGTDASPTWKIVGRSGNNQLQPHRFCTRIVIDPTNHDIVYVTFGGYVRGNVWKTSDGGVSWSNLGAALPEAPIRALAIHPRKSQFLYLGTEVGVFTSEDAGANWSPTNEGPTNCSVSELFWMKETLICVTHGRGMFTIDLASA
jgi:hypothetical protein